MTFISWFQNWAMRAGGVFCSWYGELYTLKFKDLLGQALPQTVLFCDATGAANYLDQKQTETFCQGLAKKVIQDPSVASVWCRQLVEQTDRVNALLDRLEKQEQQLQKPALADYQDLKTAVLAHVAPNFAIKKVADVLPPEVLSLHLREFSNAREYAENVYPRVQRVLMAWNKPIAKQSGYPVESLSFLLAEELENFLNGQQPLPAVSVLLKRKTGLFLHCKKGKAEVLAGKKAVALRDALFSSRSEDSLSGSCAYPGRVTGRARIVLDAAKAVDFQAGDLLITGMTRPEFLPLMKKAAAFVTDAGGMLSHAAITARELKKPCLVGTQTATTFFKDGELLEVDAENGVVRRAVVKC